MKILHTADLHFGKQLHGYSRLAEQAEFVDAFLDLASDERPDLVLLAGDLYDRAVPPAEAVSLLSRLLVGLTLELKLKVVAIAGNHDSPERVGFATDLLRSADLYLAGPPDAPVVMTFEHADGPVDVVISLTRRRTPCGPSPEKRARACVGATGPSSGSLIRPGPGPGAPSARAPSRSRTPS